MDKTADAILAKNNMPLEGSYAIWNNRGGTGKTTLTYHLANKYAIKHPDKTVLLIDMCPQADLSHAFLGNDENQMDYVSQIGTMRKEAMLINGGTDQQQPQKIAKTVSGYLDLSTSVGLPNNVDPRTFLINVSKYNPQLPRNLYLLCGDASLELVARSLEQKRSQQASLSQFGAHAWKHVTTSLKQFIRKIAERKGIKLVVFIDVNSSFSIITEIALAASDKLLLPITDDHLHRNGFEYMFALLYGFSQPSNVYYYYRHFSFYYRANEHDVKLPKIHLILNKVTRNTAAIANTTEINDNNNNNNNNNEASTASLENEWEFIFDLFKKHPQTFNLRNNNRQQQQQQSSSSSSATNNNNNLPQTLKEFKDLFVIDICEQASTNQIVRQAVRSHSPLLSLKNPANNHNGSITSCSNNSTTNNNNNNNNNPNNSTTNDSQAAVGGSGGGGGGGGNKSINRNPSPISLVSLRNLSSSAGSKDSNNNNNNNNNSKTSITINAPSQQQQQSSSASTASTTVNLSYPYQHQTHISKPNKNLILNSNNSNSNRNSDLLTINTTTNMSLVANDLDDLERSNAILFDRILDKIVDSLQRSSDY